MSAEDYLYFIINRVNLNERELLGLLKELNRVNLYINIKTETR